MASDPGTVATPEARLRFLEEGLERWEAKESQLQAAGDLDFAKVAGQWRRNFERVLARYRCSVSG